METKDTRISSMENAPTRPYKEWRAGNVKIAIWKNKKTMEDGSEIEYKSASLTRSYRKQGEDLWRHDVINLRSNDIQKAILVLNKAQEDLILSDDSKDEE